MRPGQRFSQQPEHHAGPVAGRRGEHIREHQSTAPFGGRTGATLLAARASQQASRAQFRPHDVQHQCHDQRIPHIGDGLRDSLAGTELPAPSFEPAVILVVLAILELLLEPAFETLPTGGALLTLLAEPGQHRRERFLVRRGAALSGIGRVPHELGERAQAVGGNLLVAFPEGARQQVAPRRSLQCRQQFGAAARHARDADVDARIEARAAGLDHAQRRILRARRRGDPQRRQQPQPLHAAPRVFPVRAAAGPGTRRSAPPA